MSLDQGIKHGKEHRKPYYGAGKYDKTCRPNGGCPWCYGNRMHRKVKEELDELPGASYREYLNYAGY